MDLIFFGDDANVAGANADPGDTGIAATSGAPVDGVVDAGEFGGGLGVGFRCPYCCLGPPRVRNCCQLECCPRMRETMCAWARLE